MDQNQLKALAAQLRYMSDASPWYRERLAGTDIDGAQLTTESMATLPRFDKEQHRQSQEESLSRYGHPYGLHLCAPVGQVRAVHATSGTSGLPTFYTFTQADLRTNDAAVAAGLAAAGVRPGDAVLHAYALSMFVGGVPWVRGISALGAAAVPVGAEGGTARLLQFATSIRPRVLCCTPSFAEHLIERTPEVAGVEVGSLGIELLICGGEAGAGDPAVRAILEDAYGAQVRDVQGGAWGHFATSCGEGEGMHLVTADNVLLEALDPHSGRPLPMENGVVGNLALTSLRWEAGPVLRYDMADTARFFTDRCRCGRDGLRYQLLGRTDDMIIVNGINVHPSAVRDTVAGWYPRVSGAVRVVVAGSDARVSPPVDVKVERGADEDPSGDAELATQLEALLRDALRFRARVEILDPGQLGRSDHKTRLLVRSGAAR
ncbi:phenylacetate--CoA ligase family protein [Mycolicibacterium sp. CH28]|uniref:phenylacetate--CoA ligase family protein n=1 Tax=Mycolicibacterium sp. CH28 TaxID=2512237 RepID=UPI001081B489|nr:phenylacetate--CoA ligase family protein [Mycolicibacterium sp. CH28]TGD89118.1 phenylacetate--CoA ligase family protein [Mycolicibacterium sp. CH28]